MREKVLSCTRAGALLLTVSMSLVLNGCDSHSPSTTPVAVSTLHMSWADGFSTLKDLTAHSDVVVLGSVNSVSGHGADPGVGDSTIPYTTFTVHVEGWLKGTGGAEIQVKQSGDDTVVVEDDPPLIIGQRFLGFLREYAPGQYYVVGGPTGRFIVSRTGTLEKLPAGLVNDAPPTLTNASLVVRTAAGT